MTVSSQASSARSGPLPAKVLRVHAAVGDRVDRGQPLVTLSAMKMELVCDAPAAGVVETVACRVDQLVAANDLLVSLRLDDPDPPTPPDAGTAAASG